MKCKQDGCNQNSLTTDVYCFWHSPTVDAETKQAARSRGGRHSKVIQPWNIEAIPPIQTIYDLKQLYNNALRWLSEGKITPSQANSIRNLAAGLRDCLELELVKELATGRIEIAELLAKPESPDYIEVMTEWPLLADSKLED